MQARAFTELKVLGREVRAVLHAADQGARVHGELVFPEEGRVASLGAALLGAGMARYVDWSARLLPLKPPAALASASALKKAETTAQVPVLYNPGRFFLYAIQQMILTNLEYVYLRVDRSTPQSNFFRCTPESCRSRIVPPALRTI